MELPTSQDLASEALDSYARRARASEARVAALEARIVELEQKIEEMESAAWDRMGREFFD